MPARWRLAVRMSGRQFLKGYGKTKSGSDPLANTTILQLVTPPRDLSQQLLFSQQLLIRAFLLSTACTAACVCLQALPWECQAL